MAGRLMKIDHAEKRHWLGASNLRQQDRDKTSDGRQQGQQIPGKQLLENCDGHRMRNQPTHAGSSSQGLPGPT